MRLSQSLGRCTHGSFWALPKTHQISVNPPWRMEGRKQQRLSSHSMCVGGNLTLIYFSDQPRGGSSGSQILGSCRGPQPRGKHQSWGDPGCQTPSPVYTACCTLPRISISTDSWSRSEILLPQEGLNLGFGCV